MKKHLFFDLDGTVTRSRSKIDPVMKQFLVDSGKDIIIVSGAITERITQQVDGLSCYKLGQNGNHALAPDGTVLWEEKLNEAQKVEVHAHIKCIPRTWEVSKEDDLVQDRGCQISYSLLGHNEVLEKKEAFDPGGVLRQELLRNHPFTADFTQVKIGGTTCFDYTAAGKNKGFYVPQLIKLMNWNKEASIYFGDALFPGGNDESVIGVIDTQAVADPADTLAELHNYFNK